MVPSDLPVMGNFCKFASPPLDKLYKGLSEDAGLFLGKWRPDPFSYQIHSLVIKD